MPTTMTHMAHLRAILRLGLPLIGSHVAQMAIHTTDTLMMGWYGVTELAALVLASSLYFIIFIVGSGFAFAVMPMVAAAHAEEDETQIRRVTRMGLWISAAYGIILMPLFWFSAPLLLLMGQTEEISQLAQDYLRIATIGMIPALLIMTLKSYLSALERTAVIFWLTVAAVFVNIALNYALIFGNLGAPELGIKGAAIASALSQFGSIAVLVWYIRRTLPQHTLFQNLSRSDPAAFRQVFRLGWPIGLTNLAEVGLFAASAVMMGWVGTAELAAHGIAIQWASITFMVHIGLSNAATIRAGNALGRRDQPGLRRGALNVSLLSLGFALICAAIFALFPEFLIGLFLDPTDPARTQIIAIGATLLLMAALFQTVDGAQAIALALLRGLQDTTTPMILAAISYWLFAMPLAYVLAFTLGLGAIGLWWGLVAGLTLAAILLVHRFWWQKGFIS